MAAHHPELIDDPRLLYRYTVERYHELLEAGVIEEGEPFELLNGQITRSLRNATGEDPMTVGPGHVWAVEALEELNQKLRRLGCHMRNQKPVTLPPDAEPEPDGAIVRGTRDAYRGRHPGAADVLCVIEVADASLRRDRAIKQQVYANASIPMYVIVNLLEQVVEVYSQPLEGTGRYGKVETLTPKQTLTLPAARGRTVTVPVARLLP